MAGDKSASKNATSATRPSSGQFMIAMIIVTIVAGAAGFVMASQAATPADQAQKQAGPADANSVTAPMSNLLDLPPVVTNIGAPQETWVRLETSMIFDSTMVKHPESLAAEIGADLLAYMRTVTLAQIQGPIGLQNLRQDLNERAAARSSGLVKELVIKTLVVQ
jgi:flagellar protein FliL